MNKFFYKSFFISFLVLSFSTIHILSAEASSIDFTRVKITPDTIRAGVSTPVNFKSTVFSGYYSGVKCYGTRVLDYVKTYGYSGNNPNITLWINNIQYPTTSPSEWYMFDWGVPFRMGCDFNYDDNDSYFMQGEYRFEMTRNIQIQNPGIYNVFVSGQADPFDNLPGGFNEYIGTITVTGEPPAPQTGNIQVITNVPTSYTILSNTGTGRSGVVSPTLPITHSNVPLGVYTISATPLAGYIGPSISPSPTQEIDTAGETIVFYLTYTSTGGGTCQDQNASNYGSPLPCTSGSKVNVRFNVKNQEGVTLSGATVDIGTPNPRTTDGNGVAEFQVNSNTNINYSVSLGGCQTVTSSINSGSGVNVNVELKCGSSTPICNDLNATNYGKPAPCEFVGSVNLVVEVIGPGSVTSSLGATCASNSTCTYTLPYNTYVTLNASSNPGASFRGWEGACAVFGQNGSCSGNVNSTNHRVSASFEGSGSTTVPGAIVFNIEYKQSPFNFTLANGGNVSIRKSGVVTYGQATVVKTLTEGTGQPVDLTITGAPQGVNYSIAGKDCVPNCNSIITFGVSPSTPSGTYPLTITGTPLNKTTSLNLIVQDPAQSTIVVSCSVTPTRAQINQPVTWSATVSSGVPPYTYSWTGLGIPSNPAPSTASYTHRYTTIGDKTASLTVTDSANNRGTCPPTALTEIFFQPQFTEF